MNTVIQGEMLRRSVDRNARGFIRRSLEGLAVVQVRARAWTHYDVPEGAFALRRTAVRRRPNPIFFGDAVTGLGQLVAINHVSSRASRTAHFRQVVSRGSQNDGKPDGVSMKSLTRYLSAFIARKDIGAARSLCIHGLRLKVRVAPKLAFGGTPYSFGSVSQTELRPAGDVGALIA
jgi:hypothetical protein